LGEIAAQGASRKGPRGEEQYNAALALANELGLRPLAAQCRLGLGRLWRTRDPSTARQHLTAAATMFHQMGMRSPREQAEEELA
jgi:hypothetical protein